jgi:tetratricopeptide (TPR) repeat protein
MSSSFSNIPCEIRERVYAKLLTCPKPSASEGGKAPSSPLCNLLFLNKQIHEEIKTFLKSQLCVLIKTNDPEFIQKILKDDAAPLPIVSQLRSNNGMVQQSASGAPIAMEVDLYMYHNHLSSESSPAFMIPAESIHPLLEMMWMPDWSLWAMQASASFALLDTFSHTLENATSLLIQPWISWFVPSRFVGINTSPKIPETLVEQLRAHLLGDYSAYDHMRKLNSLEYGATEKVQTEDWDAAAERYGMAAKYSEVLWTCHLECLRGVPASIPQKDLVFNLWVNLSNDFANYAQLVINAVSTVNQNSPESNALTASGNQKKLEKARELAEQGITFLSARFQYADQAVQNDEKLKKYLRKQKAKLCFRLHVVCKSIGDLGAARGYLEEALKYEPESERMLRKKMDELELEASGSLGDAKLPVVRWWDIDFE